ncbi:MAG: hypothetical protein RSA10_01945 [Bacilli bacterium]
MNQYLIAANSKRSQLIFNIFRPLDLGIAITGSVITIIAFLIVQPETLWSGAAVLFPLLFCAFLVMPIANYHNMICVLKNIYMFYFGESSQFKWKGWCASDEYK